jgi:hypothetical protein
MDFCGQAVRGPGRTAGLGSASPGAGAMLGFVVTLGGGQAGR